MFQHDWGSAGPVSGASVVCPHCGATHTPLSLVTSARTSRKAVNGGWQIAFATRVFACTACSMPYIDFPADDKTFPSVRLGATLRNLPAGIAQLYDEARDASSVGAFTACAMVARKALMNLAVLEGAKENQSFAFYVDYLASNGFVPPKGRTWVDKIRVTGNAATHEIEIVTQEGARDVMHLLENLLRFNFEMTGA